LRTHFGYSSSTFHHIDQPLGDIYISDKQYRQALVLAKGQGRIAVLESIPMMVSSILISHIGQWQLQVIAVQVN